MMEEKNVDQRGEVKHRNVCRKLFQDDDEEPKSPNSENNKGQTNGENDNFANCLFEEARRNLENAKEKWNFDFENEVPLSGRYEWVKLDRDGNEISDSAQLNNGVCDSHEEQPKEAAEVNTQEK
ncbi:cyclin-dependent kinase inhibitor 1-like isoform X2 [Odontomachus brunneus]|nr:cyclin-dependent kinase inhibitor 1-like isoform X2 [Odontomachus brunneus]XP_032677799.1 cyclin-dependent kinase inhibitor 1-like isoform X2 [Odontomachus brunneus]